MAGDSSHSFRYELDLCTLAEGETLAQWRRDRQDERAAKSRRRRASRRRRDQSARLGVAAASSR